MILVKSPTLREFKDMLDTLPEDVLELQIGSIERLFFSKQCLEIIKEGLENGHYIEGQSGELVIT